MNKSQGLENVQQLNLSVLNTLRLDLRPAQSKVEAFRNLLLLFQGTEDWININKQAPWSRLVQQLLKPKRLLKLIDNHQHYELSKNFHLLNYDVLDIHPNDEIEEILQRVVCSLISYHQAIDISNPPQVSPISLQNGFIECHTEIVNQQLSHFASSSSISTQISPSVEYQNTHRALEMIEKLTLQIKNSQIGEYVRLFQD